VKIGIHIKSQLILVLLCGTRHCHESTIERMFRTAMIMYIDLAKLGMSEDAIAGLSELITAYKGFN